MRRASLLLICLMAAGAIAVAQDLTVRSVKGTAEVKSGPTWTPLAAGESLKGASSVRLASGALLRLAGSGPVILLSQPGVYPVHRLVSLNARLHPSGLKAALDGALARLAGPTAPPAGGVSSPWFHSPSQVFLAAGRKSLASHDYVRAAAELSRGLNFASSARKAEFRVYLAYADALQGKTAKALKQISAVNPNPGAAWFSDLVLLKARLLLDGFAIRKEVAWLSRYAPGLERDSARAPLFYLLIALGYRGLGRTSKERHNLRRVAVLAPGSALATIAVRLQHNL